MLVTIGNDRLVTGNGKATTIYIKIGNGFVIKEIAGLSLTGGNS